MRIHIGSDHAGFDLKQYLTAALAERGHEVVDHGPASFDPSDDYPTFCLRTAAAVAADLGSLGIVLGGSGNGEQISANKVRGIRAALVWSVEIAQLAREHNDANVISIGARMHSREDALSFVETFVQTAFTKDPRHERRIGQIASYENSPPGAQ